MSLIKHINHYFSLIKFSHTIFALPFAMIGFTLGICALNHTIDFNWFKNNIDLFFKVLLCMVFARSAAMAFNRYLDRKIDALNPRTAQREIPAGKISSNQAFIFTALMGLGFIITTYFINELVFYLSFVALFVVLFYSYTKRFTALCHIVLGVGLSLSPIGAYLALTGRFDILPLIFSFIVLTWVSGFDIIYALQDEQFDKQNQLHSIPALLGTKKALLVSNLLHIICGLLLLIAGYYGEFNFIFWIGALLFIGLLAYQHFLVKPNDLSKVNIAFANTNGLASILFAITTIVSLILKFSS